MNDLIPTWAATLLASLLGILALFYVHRLNASRAAATAFRAAINPSAFANLRGHGLHAALAQAFPAHRAAAVEFRHHLGAVDRLRFDKAWQAYHGGDQEAPDLLAMYCIREGGHALLVTHLEALRNAATQT